MLSIAQQLAAIKPILPPRLHAKREEAEEKILQTFDTLRIIGNATINSLSKETGIPRTTVKGYMQALLREGKIVNWRLGNTTWYAVAKPAPRRQT